LIDTKVWAKQSALWFYVFLYQLYPYQRFWNPDWCFEIIVELDMGYAESS